MKIEHVEGKKKNSVMLYALSTCVWCKKTKQLLNDLGVDYDFTFVDLLEGKEREDTIAEIKKWNPDCSFPTVVLDNKTCIVGYKPELLREKLGL